ncbi:MAG: hypothetical protein U9R48_01905 [Chloroflexota bacterium]|nr:hypothetical protein [Chloroflexota bacterium]
MEHAESTIIEEWETVEIPPAPELQAVTVDPETTALLILDIQQQNCNVERRPRCIPPWEPPCGGLRVVVPVDGLSAGEHYAEQYTCWHLVNGPGTRRQAVLTRMDMIDFRD